MARNLSRACNHPPKNIYSLCLILLALALGLNACSASQIAAVEPPTAAALTPTPEPSATPAPPAALVTFSVTLLQAPPAGQKIYVDLLDEVTGLAINPERHELIASDELHYSASVPVAPGSMIKYRYSREGKPAPVEYTCAGQQVRYRLFMANGNDTVPDVICAWNDQAAETLQGRISGSVVDAQTRQPVPDILIEAAGVFALTTSDGSYLLENIPPGAHNLVAYSLDGRYQPYQQGAVVAADSNTPAPIELTPAKIVTVKFRVAPPPNTQKNLPVRLIGNILSLGNTFSDLSGGLSIRSERAPLLDRQDDGSYSLKLELPAGLDLRYKYTLGDGFWNGELDATGGFMIRQFIVPEHDMEVEDSITTWQVGTTAPVTFTASSKSTTAGEDLFIQFDAFGWTEALPMWPAGQNTWTYTLYNPQNLMVSARYRYCLAETCDLDAGMVTPEKSFAVLDQPQQFKDEVNVWGNPAAQKTPAVEKVQIARQGKIWTGIELQPGLRTISRQAFEDIHQLNSAWVVLTPAWRYTSINPPLLEALPGQDLSWSEMTAQMAMAQKSQLHIALYPQIRGGIASAELWRQARLDDDWWDRWFERYRTFILHFADLAKAGGAEALILDGDMVAPALPGIALGEGQPDHTLDDSSARWADLVAEIRTHFNGQLLWAVRYEQGQFGPIPRFVASLDQVYLLWSVPLAKKAGASEKDMQKNLANTIKRELIPLKKSLNKPILIAAGYPSLHGAATGCLKIKKLCRPFETYNAPAPAIDDFKIDNSEQALIYRVILKEISRKDYDWISGFISRGFAPTAASEDPSMSIHNKPAEQVLAQWFAGYQTREN